MIQQDVLASAIVRLDQAVASGQLPAAAKKLAARISKRLSNPVRVVILGLPGSGKSQILNFLAGSNVIPEGANLPSTQVVWGESEKSNCTLPDGSKLSFDRIDLDEIAKHAPVLVELELPLPALKKISFLEVVMGPQAADQKRAIDWAVREADMALWCTQEFDKTESGLWDSVPETLQDHSFLILTKADSIEVQANMADRLSSLNDMAADRFHSIFPMQTLQAIGARLPGGKVDKSQLTASGGRALIGAILRTVDQGTQASMDGAEILFSKHNIGPADLAEAEPNTEGPAETSVETASIEPVGAAPGITAETAKPKPAKPLESQNPEFAGKIISYISDRAQELLDQFANEAEPDTELVMQRCIEDGEWLMEQISDQPSGDQTLEDRLDSCQNAVDLMLLLQLEQQQSAVEDAVILLLQIKREFERDLAA